MEDSTQHQQPIMEKDISPRGCSSKCGILNTTNANELPKDAFEEFFNWSFTIANEKIWKLDPFSDKKFSKKAPTTALMLREEKVTIDTLLNKRRERLKRFDLSFHFPTSFLLNSLCEYFKSEGERIDFGQKLQAAFRKKKLKDESKESIIIYQKVFDEEFEQHFTSDSKLLRKHQALENETSLVGKSTDVVLRDLLKSALKPVFVEIRYQCWRCNTSYDGGQRKITTVCQGCECAQYCSRECQLDDWKRGHKEMCGEICKFWSVYLSNKDRIEKARKEGRVWSESVVVNGEEHECFLHPSTFFDYQVCMEMSTSGFSIETFYRNIATISCGGKHPIFENETINPTLQLTGFMFGLLPIESNKEQAGKNLKAFDASRRQSYDRHTCTNET